MSKDTLTTYESQIQHLNAIKANDDVTLKQIYQANYEKTERYVLNNQGTVDEARDVYQEAFIAVWRNIKLDKFKPVDENSLGGYLYRIAKNKWLDVLRSGHHRKIVSMNDNHVVADEADEIREEDQQYLCSVRREFENLGETCRAVLTRFYFKNESLRTISSAFNWTEATARNNKYRCLQQLRQLLKNK